MRDLMRVDVNENNEQVVSGRELHEFLEVGTQYTKWFERMKEYGFAESVDFDVIVKNDYDDTAFGGVRKITDHKISIDMAKEISMIQRTERGKQARLYFIELEKAWNSPEQLMARALQMADKQIEGYKREIQTMKPKVLFADAVQASKTSILVGELAKILKQNGIDMGQNRFFEWLRGNGYLIRRKGTDYNMPTQRSMDLELFEIKETSITHSDGHISVNKTPKVTGKGQIYFINKFKAGDKELQRV